MHPSVQLADVHTKFDARGERERHVASRVAPQNVPCDLDGARQRQPGVRRQPVDEGNGDESLDADASSDALPRALNPRNVEMRKEVIEPFLRDARRKCSYSNIIGPGHELS